MDPKIKHLYIKILTRYSFDYPIGTQLYEADHWAELNIDIHTAAFNYIKPFIYDKKILSDYKRYGIERCKEKFKLPYCPICYKFFNKKPSFWKQLRYKKWFNQFDETNGDMISACIKKIEAL